MRVWVVGNGRCPRTPGPSTRSPSRVSRSDDGAYVRKSSLLFLTRCLWCGDIIIRLYLIMYARALRKRAGAPVSQSLRSRYPSIDGCIIFTFALLQSAVYTYMYIIICTYILAWSRGMCAMRFMVSISFRCSCLQATDLYVSHRARDLYCLHEAFAFLRIGKVCICTFPFYLMISYFGESIQRLRWWLIGGRTHRMTGYIICITEFRLEQILIGLNSVE